MTNKRIGLIGLIGIALVLALTMPAMATSDKVIEFTWEHEDPAAQGVTAFKIYMSSESGTGYIWLFDIPFETVLLTYTADTTITVPDNAETMRYFVATAVDAQGNESGYSNEASVNIDNLPPNTPITFKAVVKIITD